MLFADIKERVWRLGLILYYPFLVLFVGNCRRFVDAWLGISVRGVGSFVYLVFVLVECSWKMTFMESCLANTSRILNAKHDASDHVTDTISKRNLFRVMLQRNTWYLKMHCVPEPKPLNEHRLRITNWFGIERSQINCFADAKQHLFSATALRVTYLFTLGLNVSLVRWQIIVIL